jgi:transposase-like protein
MPSSDSTMTFDEFLQRFPSNDACLEDLKQRFYPDGTECPKCGKPSRFYRIKERSAYSCQFCGRHVYPTSNTIFHKSTVSLQLWYYAIFLMASTRCGISAKQLEREIGVSNKTALRMFKQIRTILNDADERPLSGKVEVDETGVGGKPRASQRMNRKEAAHWRNDPKNKTTVMGMVERGGQVRAFVVPDRTAPTLMGKIREYVLPDSMIYTDELRLYSGVGREFKGHKRIKHSQRIYVDGDVTTNAIEGYFALAKNGIRGVYHSVSAKYLQLYLDEYSFRYNRRESATPMFWAMLDRVQKTA